MVAVTCKTDEEGGGAPRPFHFGGKAPPAATRTGRGATPANPMLPPGRRGAGRRREQSRKKKRLESFSLYIYKVLRQIHPETSISRKSMHIMNSFINDIFDQMSTEAVKLANIARKRTLSSREVQTAARLLLPGELSRHAVTEGTKAVAKFSRL
eukprot:Polyplicarium_translucidae@DN1956_c0_g1_i1.p2